MIITVAKKWNLMNDAGVVVLRNVHAQEFRQRIQHSTFFRNSASVPRVPVGASAIGAAIGMSIHISKQRTSDRQLSIVVWSRYCSSQYVRTFRCRSSGRSLRAMYLSMFHQAYARDTLDG